MNKDIFAGKWKELKGKTRQRWAELSDDDVENVKGQFEELSGLLQQRYGYKKERAEKDIDDFMNGK
jgi:uncharacterized protein YjbJ (UPF0337 family)